MTPHLYNLPKDMLILQITLSQWASSSSRFTPFDITSSSAIAKRSCDASCLLVVSFNVQNVQQSFIVSYIGYRFITVCNKMLFCCLWHSIETSCHKHFVIISHRQQILPLTTSNKCHNLWDHAALTAHSEARYRLRIAISAYTSVTGVPVRISPRHLVQKK